ncbi:hypothetical protein GCM10022403_034290 [Streptomyces coacervatus]|uniref:Uncharacterized protein n=1 Tax=Streptomyces coacervatus TaxID=647381 RepID=A0ABP7HT94_9ACTN
MGTGRDSFSRRNCRDLVVHAHIQLKVPIVLIWDCENDSVPFGSRPGSVWD